jgi:hypothetical protein
MAARTNQTSLTLAKGTLIRLLKASGGMCESRNSEVKSGESLDEEG